MEKCVIIGLYVDDMLIFGIDLEQIENIKKFLSNNFAVKDIGVVDVVLGIKITREESTIALSQSHYIEKVLKKFDLFNCILSSTPMDP